MAHSAQLFTMEATRSVRTISELSGMKMVDLKEELSRRGLPVSGRKAELIERLAEQMRPNSRQRSGTARQKEALVSHGRPALSRTSQVDVGTSDPSSGRGRGRAVLIVESPAKCSTIAKFLGHAFTVLPCNGHVRNLPSRSGSVRPEEGFAMTFETQKGAPKLLKSISDSLKDARAMYLATDPDREGEAIAWHLCEELRLRNAIPPNLPVHRVSFTEITERAVQAALKSPKPVDMQLVRAQQARQAVDYLVGFSLSPILWRKLPGCRSAGRVQSVALRLVVEREQEVQRFIPREYWSVGLEFQSRSFGRLNASLTHLRGERLQQFDLASEDATMVAVESLPEEWAVSQALIF